VEGGGGGKGWDGRGGGWKGGGRRFIKFKLLGVKNSVA
jgi:hypothetical protein